MLRFLGWRQHAGSAYHRSDAETVDLALASRPGGPRPELLWVHLYGAHWPYAPSPAAAARQGLDPAHVLVARGLPGLAEGEWEAAEIALGARLYRAQMEDLDAEVGRILAGLPAETVVVVVGDHGESLGEHGETFSHGRLAFAPGLRVPLLLRAQGVAPGVEDEVVGLEDIAPTLLELLGLPPDPGMRGGSLLRPDPDRVHIGRCFPAASPPGPMTWARWGGGGAPGTPHGGPKPLAGARRL